MGSVSVPRGVGSGVPTVEQLMVLRMSRTQVVRLAAAYSGTELDNVLKGCFIRVLLDTGDGVRQQYRIARVCSTTLGEEYTGFSFGNETSCIYLELDVQERGSTKRNTIQFNSVSNGEFTQDEYEAWLSDPSECAQPTPNELAAKCRELEPVLRNAGCLPVEGLWTRWESLFPSLAPPVAPDRTVMAPRGPADAKKRKLPAAAAAANEDIRKQLEARIKELEADVRRRKAFPSDLETLNNDELNGLEDSVNEYLGAIRKRRRELHSCKICMDKEINVILLPCKHQAMCLDCSEKVHHCPLCRQAIRERIRPHAG